MADKYRSFAELARAEAAGVDYRVHTRDAGPTLILAPHGGGIEPGTSELAAAIAGDDHSLYVFEGLKTQDNNVLHITSANFDEPKCLIAVGRCDTVLAVHGEDGETAVVHVGGLDIAGRARVELELKRAGFDARDIDQLHLAGESPKNICNRGHSGSGIQLEISTGLRRTLFHRLSPRADRQKTTEAFNRFVTAVRTGLQAPK